MGHPAGLFDLEQSLAGLWKKGYDLDWPQGRGRLRVCPARPRAGRAARRPAKGARPPFDHVLMFKIVILQTRNH
jgi:IS5 family transposase